METGDGDKTPQFRVDRELPTGKEPDFRVEINVETGKWRPGFRLQGPGKIISKDYPNPSEPIRDGIVKKQLENYGELLTEMTNSKGEMMAQKGRLDVEKGRLKPVNIDPKSPPGKKFNIDIGPKYPRYRKYPKLQLPPKPAI